MSLIIGTENDPERQEKFRTLETAWLEELKTQDRTAATREKYRDAVRAFWVWCQETDILLGDVERGDVCRWRDDQLVTYSVSTVKQRLAAVRGFYDFLIERALLVRNPADRVRCAGSASPRAPLQREELTDAEMQALLASCDVYERDPRVALRDRAILYLMAYCGLRTIEIHRAKRQDLRQRGGRWVLWVQRKGHRSPDDYVVIPARAEAALRAWLVEHPLDGRGPLFVSLSRINAGAQLSSNYIRRMVKRRLRSCGIDSPAKTTHSLRHSAITRARRGGSGIFDIMAMAGHQKPETTSRYVHGKRRLRKAAEDRINYGEDE